MLNFDRNIFYKFYQSKNWYELNDYLNSFQIGKDINEETYQEIFKNKDIILNYYVANFYLKNFEKCIEIIKLFKNCDEIDNFIIDQTDFLKDIIFKNKKIIGTYDPSRKSENENEIVIIIGDYPVQYDSLIVNNPIKRNYKWALKFNYDYFEGHNVWNRIDKIFIINLDKREDRLFDILKECKKATIPLNKIKRISAQIFDGHNNHYVNGSIGCSLSHLKVVKEIHEKGYENSLIFEDDFTFSDPMENNLKNLEKFFEKGYSYDVTFLAYSSLHHKENYDDLLRISFQHCTTASGYLISLDGSKKIKDIWEEGLQKLIQTGDVEKYACDIYWKKLQSDKKMFLFKDKIGYQRPSFSSISSKLVYNLD